MIIVHGGAGRWPYTKHQDAMRGAQQACEKGYAVLDREGTAIDAVQAAIVELEDNPIFNAGTGSTMNLTGKIENDASIMNGKTLQAGSVALVKGVRNPIVLARKVMEETDHVLVAGRTTQNLANTYGLAKSNPVTRERWSQWLREKRKLLDGRSEEFRKNLRLVRRGKLGPGVFDTVGALALDDEGSFAAGASTGGMTLKLPGRIGDTALVGAGLYADNRLGAATATGIGELAIRMVLSKTACDIMRIASAQEAAARTIRLASHRVGNGLGLITLDREGRYGIAHSTHNICWAAIDANHQGQRGKLAKRIR